EGLECARVGGQRQDLLPEPVPQCDQQHLIEVELAAEAPAARAVDGHGMLAVRDGPTKLAQVGAFRATARLAEQLEDRLPAAVRAGDGHGPGHPPHRVLGDHLEQRARVASLEGVEDPLDVVERAQRSRGAMVSPYPPSWEW